MSQETIFCEKCTQPSIQACLVCLLPFCSTCEKCPNCRQVSICHGDETNCFLKASRDLEPGEIVLTGLPLAVGPKIPLRSGCMPCVGCCRPIFEEGIIFCPDCLWPLCSLDCEGFKNKTHAQECKVLSRYQSDSPKARLENYRFRILLPLRVLLTQTKDLEQLPEKIEHVPLDEDLEYLDKLLGNSFELLKVFNYVQRNSLEVGDFQIVYHSLDLLLHSCTPNSFIQIGSNEITVRARTPICLGAPITLSFTDVYQGTQERLLDLSSRNLTCSCPRCLDPTEFGTFFSALKCLGTKIEPCGGTQLPKDGLWVCDKCLIELPNDQMVKFVQHLGNEVGKVLDKGSTVEELEELLAKLLMFLHPNHFHVCRVKRALVKSYNDEVATKAELCRSLIEVLGKLYNGGVVLGELYHELLLAVKTGDEALQAVEALKKNVEALANEEFSKTVADVVTKV